MCRTREVQSRASANGIRVMGMLKGQFKKRAPFG